MSGSGSTPPGGAPEGPDDVDRQFSEIVAGLRRPPPAAAGWRQGAEVDEEDDHFVPPPPPPLPAGDLHFWGIVIGLTLGPVLLVLANVVPLLRGEVWSWLGIGLCVAGFVLLVLRLPTHRDGDWGAQV